MTVRAKLYVSEVKRQASTPDAVQVTLAAVTRGDENKAWAEATPSAQFSMTIQNPTAAVAFTLGQEFYVDFEPIGEPAKLADGHEYLPGSYEADMLAKGQKLSYEQRCAACGGRHQSHEEPFRSQIAEWRP